jgi:YVTN family beta-propeller protein/VCBS repeat-containing protein
MIAFADACGRQWIGGVGELGASAFVGRVGGLAVALGVGMVISGVGTAWASPADSSDSSASAEGAESATESASTPSKPRRSPARGGASRSTEPAEVTAVDAQAEVLAPLPVPTATTARRTDREGAESAQGPAAPPSSDTGLHDARVGVPLPSASTPQQSVSGERVELPRGTRTDLDPIPQPTVEAPASVGALIDSGDLRSPATAAVPTPVSAPLIVAPAVAAQPVMLAAPKPAAAYGLVESVWAPLLGSGSGAPVQSPVSWVMLAAARRELDAPKAVKAPAATVSTGQLVAPAATTVAVPGAAATNSAPVITSVTLGAPNATTGTVTGTVKASDANGDRMTYKATVASAAKGKVTITTAGVFTYTPTATARHAAAKVGATTAVTTDTVTVTVTDAKGAAVTRAVSVPVSPKNSVPTATKTVGTPNATTGVVTGKVTATDADRDPVAYSVPAATAKGTVAITSAGAFTYTPTAAARHAAARIGATTAAKTDTFNVTVTDGYGGQLAVPITVSISPRNTAPTATVSIAKPDPVTGIAKGKVTATDADKDTLSFTATKPANGTVAVNSDGSFAYTPTATARASARTSTTAKTDTFTITVADGHGGTKAVSVSATIAPSNSAPVAGTPTASTNATTGVVTGTINATDPDKDTLTYTATTITTAKGSAAITSTGAYTYTPTATARHAAARTGATTAVKTDTFTATVTDKYGATTAIPVNVTIHPANTVPVPGTPTVGRPFSFDGVVTGTVSATDADRDTLSFSAPANTAKGAVSINASTGAFTYTPTLPARQTATAATTDRFGVTVTDGYGGSQVINVVVPVDPGTPEPGVITMSEPDPTTGVVYGGMGWFVPAQLRAAFSGSGASTGGGTVVVNASTSEFTYTPTREQRLYATASTTDTFTISASNGVNTGTQTITVPVSALPGIPTAPVVAGTPTVNPATGAVTGSLLAADPKGLTLTYAATGNPASGKVTVKPDGTYTYTPSNEARVAVRTGTGPATDAFTVTATNGTYTSSAATISVAIASAASPNSVVGKIAMNGLPGRATISADGTRLYVATYNSRYGGPASISVIDTATSSVTATIGLDSDKPPHMAISRDGGRLYTVNSSSDSVLVFDTATNAQTATIALPVGSKPTDVAVSPDGTRVYTANAGGTISVIDTGTNTVTAIIDFPKTLYSIQSYPISLAVSPDGTRIYAATAPSQSSSVSVIDTAANKITATIFVPYCCGPEKVAVSPDGLRVYATSNGTYSGQVAVIDPATNKVITIIQGLYNPYSLAVSSDGTRVYTVTSSLQGDSGSMSVIDPGAANNQLTMLIPVGSGSTGLAVSPDGAYAYVTNLVDRTVTVIYTGN